MEKEETKILGQFYSITCCLMYKPVQYTDLSRYLIVHTDTSGHGVETVLARIQRLPQSVDSENGPKFMVEMYDYVCLCMIL